MKNTGKLFVVFCFLGLALSACKAKKGDAGPAGLAGTVSTVYSGVYPATIPTIPTVFNVTAPVLTINSVIDIHYSTDGGVTWLVNNSYSINANTKVIAINLLPGAESAMYRIIVQNPG